MASSFLALVPQLETVLGTTDFQHLTAVLFPEAEFQRAPDALVRDLAALNGLRRAAVAGDGGVAAGVAYARQLAVLGGKGVGASSVAFTWTSSTSSTTSSTTSTSSSTSFQLAFERVAVWCRVGRALLAAAEDAADLRDAAARAQAAAACFATAQALDAAAAALFAAPRSRALSLAAAQAAFVRRALGDAKTPAVVARLAAAAADLAAAAGPAAAAPAAVFRARASVLMAAAAAQKAAVGCHAEEIAFLRHAVHTLQAAVPASPSTSTSIVSWMLGKDALADSDAAAALLTPKLRAEANDLLEEAKALLASAEKDNDIVYLEPVPPFESLPPIVPAVMVKPSDISTLWSYLNAPFVPLFECIIPENLRKIQSQYAQALASHLIPFVDLAEATTECRSTLSTLSLPQSIESLSKTNADFLKDLMSSTTTSTLSTSPNNNNNTSSFSVKSLDFQTAQLVSLRQTCTDTLNHALASLDAEQQEDSALRSPSNAFGSRWNRVDSSLLTTGLRDAAVGYKAKLDAARLSDDAVSRKVGVSYESICLLGGGADSKDAETMHLLQLGGANTSLASTVVGGVDRIDVVVKLRAVLTLLSDVIEKRNKILEQVDEMKLKDDIAPRLLEASEKNESFDAALVISEQLSQYDALIKQGQDSIKSQNDIMKLVVSRNAAFVEWKQSQPLLLKRDQFAKDYNSARTMYREIMGNLAGGIRFYSEFLPILQKFDTNCSDFCMTRNIEKKELLAELQQASLNQQSTRAPLVASAPAAAAVWDGNVQFSFNPNPPTSIPPPFKRP
ncbi:ALIX V-shaped domain binding to HIV-domain-containing protein [Obelidium mucronatum]|nr:ALIX V-shaped domain binding to HIV-domain-containing protein [Obelidium mucronatum]